jgi:serine/threonine protein kinase
MSMTEPQPLYPGVLIGGHYTVGTLINTGGFGSVYRGIDASERNRPCAIKETYDVTPAARRQALMEAAILFTVNTEHLPQVYDAFEANGRFYLVMQLIEGENLLQLLDRRNRPCSEQEVLAWLLPIMDVLQELHSRNPPVMHRDIKPANIILTPNQAAVLVDFGLTKLYDPGKDTSTLIRAVSVGFSPVEQYIGKTSPQSDIYALAATMYFLLTQTTPPASIDRSLQDFLVAPRVLNPLISPRVERVLLKALAVSPDERYQSMQEFARALREPAFQAYTAPTISDNSLRIVQAPEPAVHSGVANVYPPASSTNGRYSADPSQVPADRSSPPPVYPVPPPARPTRSPVNPKVRQAPPTKAQRLPGPLNQGCLWGVLQGVLSALILLLLRKEVFFYLALLEGFLFYLLAGFFTVHKGGGTYRGAWAGFWSGISSTIVFWLVFPLILLILLAQRIQLDTAIANKNGIILNFDQEFLHALQVVAPILPNNHSTSQTPAVGLIVYLASGLLCAIILGLLGGILGKRSYRKRYRNT